MLIHAKNTVFWLFDPISRPQDPARDNFEPLGWHMKGAHFDGSGLPQTEPAQPFRGLIHVKKARTTSSKAHRQYTTPDPWVPWDAWDAIT